MIHLYDSILAFFGLALALAAPMDVVPGIELILLKEGSKIDEFAESRIHPCYVLCFKCYDKINNDKTGA